MAKFTTFRIIVAIGVVINFEMHQINIKTTFLNENLEEDIYIDQSQGFVEKRKYHLIYKLKKFLYELK